MVRLLLPVCLLFILSPGLQAQSSTDSLSRLHSPTRATLYSAALPGAGQVYNRKYWKVPVLYAGFAGLGYLVKVNHDDYRIYKNAYKDRLDGDESTRDEFENVYSDQDLATLKNYYRRNRDLSIIGIGVLYILNIIDATVDAHLFHFDVSDELSMRLTPGYNPGFRAEGPSLTLHVQF